MFESESTHSDTDSMSEEEPILKLFHPTTGEELDPDSIQYQVLCRFLYSNNNFPSPRGISNQQDEDLHQGQYLLGEGLRRPIANHIPEGLYQGQLENAPPDTEHQEQRNDPHGRFRTRTNPLFFE